MNYKRKPKPFKPAPERRSLQWSNYQTKVFSDIATGDGNTVVMAGPGSGKSEVIIEGTYHVPADVGRVLVTSFNAPITEKLSKRVPSHVIAATHHAIGFRTTRKNWGHVYNLSPFGSVDKRNDSMFAMATKIVGDKQTHERLRQMLVHAVDMCKITLADTPEQVTDVLDNYGVDLCGFDISDFTDITWKMLDECKHSPRILNGRNVISFADMIWLPHVHGWMPDQFDHIFVDEGQDLSPARTEILLNALAYGGRFHVVGDENQAIYSWAGSRTDSMQWLIKTLSAKTLPLSVSYRCARRIIELARQVNPMIEAAPDAPEGTIEHFEAEDLYNQVKPGTAIISRVNFPLVRACMAMINMGMKANIQGKDIAERFNWRIDCWQPDSIEALLKSVHIWKEDVCARLAAKSRWSTIELIADEAASIGQFCDHADNVDEVKSRITEFFSDDESQIKLSSGHKAKGLEWDSVIMLDKTFHLERGGEEANVWYVATTRAKTYLGIAEGKLP